MRRHVTLSAFVALAAAAGASLVTASSAAADAGLSSPLRGITQTP